METTVKLMHIRQSSSKIRFVLKQVSGMRVNDALNKLSNTNKKASNFISKNANPSEVENHHVIPDVNGKFISFSDIKIFYDDIKNLEGQSIERNGGIFKISKEFQEDVKALIGKKRYNAMTNDHITNNEIFDKKHYDEYLTHIDYNSLQSLKIETVFNWEPTSALIWDRTTLHASNNYLVDGVENKLGMAIFTVRR